MASKTTDACFCRGDFIGFAMNRNPNHSSMMLRVTGRCEGHGPKNQESSMSVWTTVNIKGC